jgi:hypothetical protein
MLDFQFNIAGILPSDPDNGNIDVEIIFNDGTKYVPTFFTLKNISSLMDSYRDTGECKNGLYFLAADTIIVKQITKEVISETINDLVKTGELFTICKKHTL